MNFLDTHQKSIEAINVIIPVIVTSLLESIRCCRRMSVPVTHHCQGMKFDVWV
jgi:hypothetical protein